MKRKLSLLFALIMIAQMTACSESPVQEESTSAAESAITADTAESEEIETVPEETFPELTTLPAGLSYDGYDIKIYSFEHSRYKWEHVAEELTGEALNDAIFYRNSNTSELLDVKITAIINKWDNTDFRTKVTAAVMSGRQMAEDIGFLIKFADRMVNAVCCPVERKMPENMKQKLDEYLCRKRPEGK